MKDEQLEKLKYITRFDKLNLLKEEDAMRIWSQVYDLFGEYAYNFKPITTPASTFRDFPFTVRYLTLKSSTVSEIADEIIEDIVKDPQNNIFFPYCLLGTDGGRAHYGIRFALFPRNWFFGESVEFYETKFYDHDAARRLWEQDQIYLLVKQNRMLNEEIEDLKLQLDAMKEKHV